MARRVLLGPIVTIHWGQELATGIEQIDAQHRQLYETVAQLHTLMRSKALSEVDVVLDALTQYASEHFATEEREMRSSAYPGFDDHRAAHLAFVQEFVRIRGLLEVRPTVSGVVELSSWLSDWLREHVRGLDAEMARFLRPPPAHRKPAA